MVIPPMGGVLVATGTLLPLVLCAYEEMRSVQNRCTMQGPQDVNRELVNLLCYNDLMDMC